MVAVTVDEGVTDNRRARISGAQHGRRVDEFDALHPLGGPRVYGTVAEGLASRECALLQAIEGSRDALGYVLVRVRNVLDDRHLRAGTAQLLEGGDVPLLQGLLAGFLAQALPVFHDPVDGEAARHDEVRALPLRDAPQRTLPPFVALAVLPAQRDVVAGHISGRAGALGETDQPPVALFGEFVEGDRKSTRLNSSHANISYAVFCLHKNTTSPA